MLSKDKSGYHRGHGPNGSHCSICRFFVAPDECEFVSGNIRPDDGCKLFKPAGKADGGGIPADDPPPWEQRQTAAPTQQQMQPQGDNDPPPWLQHGQQPQAEAGQKMPGIIEAGIQGAKHGFGQVGQTLGVSGEQEESPAAAPLKWSDVGHPIAQLAPKLMYRLGEGSPTIAGGLAGAAAGTGIGTVVPGVGNVAGGIGGGALGAAAMSAAQTIGPVYAQELQKTPNDPDGAYARALKNGAVSAVFSGAGWALFPSKLFSGPIKNLVTQMFAVQPAVSAAHQAAQNVVSGRPIGENVGQAIGEGVAGSLIPAVGHGAIALGKSAARPRVPQQSIHDLTNAANGSFSAAHTTGIQIGRRDGGDQDLGMHLRDGLTQEIEQTSAKKRGEPALGINLADNPKLSAALEALAPTPKTPPPPPPVAPVAPAPQKGLRLAQHLNARFGTNIGPSSAAPAVAPAAPATPRGPAAKPYTTRDFTGWLKTFGDLANDPSSSHDTTIGAQHAYATIAAYARPDSPLGRTGPGGYLSPGATAPNAPQALSNLAAGVDQHQRLMLAKQLERLDQTALNAGPNQYNTTIKQGFRELLQNDRIRSQLEQFPRAYDTIQKFVRDEPSLVQRAAETLGQFSPIERPGIGIMHLMMASLWGGWDLHGLAAGVTIGAKQLGDHLAQAAGKRAYAKTSRDVLQGNYAQPSQRGFVGPPYKLRPIVPQQIPDIGQQPSSSTDSRGGVVNGPQNRIHPAQALAARTARTVGTPKTTDASTAGGGNKRRNPGMESTLKLKGGGTVNLKAWATGRETEIKSAANAARQSARSYRDHIINVPLGRYMRHTSAHARKVPKASNH